MDSWLEDDYERRQGADVETDDGDDGGSIDNLYDEGDLVDEPEQTDEERAQIKQEWEDYGSGL